jgi:hypothetical protein
MEETGKESWKETRENLYFYNRGGKWECFKA